MHCNIGKHLITGTDIGVENIDSDNNKVEVCSKHYRFFYRRQEVHCFICKKREDHRGSYYHPMNAQLLQKGSREDVSQEELASARLCGRCHIKHLRSSGEQVSSDVALDDVIVSLTAEAHV